MKSVTLTPVVYQDTWSGLTVTHDPAPESPLASVRMFFRDKDRNLGLQLATGSGVTITDAAGWSFEVDAITSFPLAAGTWFWSIEATATDSTIKTRVSGIITVIFDATY
jgi:hypothetical protein